MVEIQKNEATVTDYESVVKDVLSQLNTGLD